MHRTKLPRTYLNDEGRGPMALMRFWAMKPPFIKEEMRVAQQAIQKLQTEKSAALIQEIVLVA